MDVIYTTRQRSYNVQPFTPAEDLAEFKRQRNLSRESSSYVLKSQDRTKLGARRTHWSRLSCPAVSRSLRRSLFRCPEYINTLLVFVCSWSVVSDQLSVCFCLRRCYVAATFIPNWFIGPRVVNRHTSSHSSEPRSYFCSIQTPIIRNQRRGIFRQLRLIYFFEQ